MLEAGTGWPVLTAFQVLTQNSKRGCYTTPCWHPSQDRAEWPIKQGAGSRQGTSRAWDYWGVGAVKTVEHFWAAPMFCFPLSSTYVSCSISHVPAMTWGLKMGQLQTRVSTFSKEHDPSAAPPSQGKGAKAHRSCRRSQSMAEGAGQSGLNLAKALGNCLLVREPLLIYTHFLDHFVHAQHSIGRRAAEIIIDKNCRCSPCFPSVFQDTT